MFVVTINPDGSLSTPIPDPLPRCVGLGRGCDSVVPVVSVQARRPRRGDAFGFIIKCTPLNAGFTTPLPTPRRPVDLFIIDAAKVPGESLKLDWSALPPRGLPAGAAWLLAGGLTADNVRGWTGERFAGDVINCG